MLYNDHGVQQLREEDWGTRVSNGDAIVRVEPTLCSNPSEGALIDVATCVYERAFRKVRNILTQHSCPTGRLKTKTLIEVLEGLVSVCQAASGQPVDSVLSGLV